MIGWYEYIEVLSATRTVLVHRDTMQAVDLSSLYYGIIGSYSIVCTYEYRSSTLRYSTIRWHIVLPIR